jgi:hypothetical protein
MRYSPVALAAAWLLLLGPVDASAELIQWSYNWSRSPAEVHSSNHGGAGFISLTKEGMKSAAGDSYLVATNLQAHSKASLKNPDVFTNRAYTLKLFLQDKDSGQSGTLSFTGEFNGTISAESTRIANTFTGKTTQTLVLGDHLFTVTIGPYSDAGPPGAVNVGSIAARADVTVSSIFHLPEPSAFVLASLGAGGFLLRRRRRLK